MKNKVIFIGPLYPPRDVINYFSALTVYITTNSISNTDGYDYNGLRYPAIKDLNITSGAVTFTLIASVPGTGILPIVVPSTSEDIIFQTNTAAIPNDFNGGDSLYNISPCCITLTGYNTVPMPADIEIQCKSPVQCTMSGNKLYISLTQPSELPAPADITEDGQQSGIKTINGVGGGGDITITGVGSVAVAVSPRADDEQQPQQ